MDHSSIILQPLYSPPKLSVCYPQLDKLFYNSDDQCSNNRIQPTNIMHISELTTDVTLNLADQILQSCHELAMTLLFSDNTTLLNDAQVKQRCNQKVEAVCVAVSHLSIIYYVVLHFVPVSSDIWDWIRNKLTNLLESSKAIGYQMNEVLCTTISHFQISDLCTSISKWKIFDVGVAFNLIEQQDRIPSYLQLLARYNIKDHTTNGVAYLCTIGVLMTRLYHQLINNRLWSLFVNLEMRILPLVSVMESYGLLVNVDLLKQYNAIVKLKVFELEQSIFSLVGHSFSINSTQQLRKVLYDDLKLDRITQTRLSKTAVNKHTSTSEATLVILQEYHPLPKLILEYRQMGKLKALIENLISHAILNQNSLRPCWQSMGTVTGRITCCNPNVQAFPKHPTLVAVKTSSSDDANSTHSINIRATIHSRHNYSFVVSDFKSIELCVLADVTGDLKLIAVLKDAVLKDKDVFQLLASEWLGMSSDSITSRDREKTKRIVYSLIYGIGKEKLSQLLNISPESAQHLTTSFLGKYTKVKEFMTSTVQQCRKTKYCTTLCGRLRKFDNINSANYVLRTFAERQCINFIIQGSATDICKTSMLKINKSLSDKHISGRLLIQVHDEFVYEVLDTQIDLMVVQMRSVMQSDNVLADYTPNGLKVPLSVRITSGKQWSQLTVH